MSKVAPIYTSSFEFQTKGKRVNVGKIARGLAQQMNRQYICHSSKQSKTKVSGKLITTRKGMRLSNKQKTAAKKLAR